MSYTKGPWKICKSDRSLVCDKDSDNPNAHVIARLWDNRWLIRNIWETNANEGVANAHLIAAAPDLLESSKALLDKINNMTTQDFSLGAERIERKALQNAIAKAEGRE